jgi:hypothetical protein
MLKAAGFYTAVFVVGTATMILAHKLNPQKPTRSAGTTMFEKRVSGSAFPELKFITARPSPYHMMRVAIDCLEVRTHFDFTIET